jgi:hypothetical protein
MKFLLLPFSAAEASARQTMGSSQAAASVIRRESLKFRFTVSPPR